VTYTQTHSVGATPVRRQSFISMIALFHDVIICLYVTSLVLLPCRLPISVIGTVEYGGGVHCGKR